MLSPQAELLDDSRQPVLTSLFGDAFQGEPSPPTKFGVRYPELTINNVKHRQIN